MKKQLFLFVLLVLCSLFIFADDAQEEIDYLLFLPNSDNQFVDEVQAGIQLDNLAKFLKGKDLVPGQIFVYGYAAISQNDIDDKSLSKNRAVFVINELQKRGLSIDNFADPVGYGSVDLWGSNLSEEDKIPNRRVRVLLDGKQLTPVVTAAVEAPKPAEKPAEEPKAESGRKFPWILLLPLLLALLLVGFLLSRRKKSPVFVEEPRPAAVQEAPAPVPLVVTTSVVVDLDEEIRRRAYDLFLERGGMNGDAEGDWYRAVCDVCARYEADDYRTRITDGYWQALKTQRT